MADIFGRTEVLPSWLRDDPSRVASGFSMGMQAARAGQANKQQAIENQRADRRLTMEQDQDETRKMLVASQVEGQRLKVDEAKAFAADTPAILAFGEAANRANTLEELDRLTASVKLSSVQGQAALDRVWASQQGRIAQRELSRFGSRIQVKKTAAEAALGRPINGDEYRQLAIEATAELDPNAFIGKILPAEISADAKLDVEQLRSETRIELGEMRGSQLLAAAQAKAISQGLGGVRGAVLDNALPGLVAGLKEIGYEPSETEIQSFRSKAIAGGVDPTKAPPAVVKTLAADSIGFRKLENINKRIEAFDRKHGAGAFEDFIGPFDQPVFNFRTKTIPKDKLSLAEKEARSIFTTANEAVQSYRNGQFGTALTAGETETFKGIAGSPDWNSYVSDLKTFQENLGRDAAERTRDWIWAVNIPDRIKSTFFGYLTPEDETAGVAAPTGRDSAPAVKAAPPLPPKWKFTP